MPLEGKTGIIKGRKTWKTSSYGRTELDVISEYQKGRNTDARKMAQIPSLIGGGDGCLCEAP